MKTSMTKHDVRDVSRAKAALVSRYFIFKAMRTQKQLVRVAFAFSAKTANAVVRNRFKRRIREILKSHVVAAIGFDVLCIARAPLSKMSGEAWQNERQRLEGWCESIK